MHEPYEGNPVTATGPLAEGQLGLVVAPTGLGKTAFLVHTALSRLLRGEDVLHLALDQTGAHAVGHYDALLAMIRERLRVDDAATLVERHRQVLAPGATLDWARLEALLDTLQAWGSFAPRWVVADGWSAAQPGLSDQMGALRERLVSRGLAGWVSLRHDGAVGDLDEAVTAHADRIVRLAALGPAVGLQVTDPAASDAAPEPHRLDPTSLLIQPPEATPAPGRPTLDPSTCTLYSGGAPGSESAFGEVAAQYGVREVAFTFEGHRQARTEGRTVLTEGELAMGDVSLAYVSKRLRRSYHDRESLIRGVLQTIWHMVSRSEQVFVVGAIQEDGTVRGGTGWAVELASMWSRELWVFDVPTGRWNRWSGRAFGPGQPRITSRAFCGTGTRQLPDLGRQAIEELFAHSFPKGA